MRDRIVTLRTAEDLPRLEDRFQVQEQALADASSQFSAGLRSICQKALLAMELARSEQKFGELCADEQSLAVQGIVGQAQDGVRQSFGKMAVLKHGRAFQGQIDTASFALMWGGH
jgi:hypothetical protein